MFRKMPDDCITAVSTFGYIEHLLRSTTTVEEILEYESNNN